MKAGNRGFGMMAIARGVLAVACAVAGSVRGQEKPAITNSIVPADSLSRTTVGFESPIQFDWRQLAISNFHVFDVLHPDPDVLRRAVQAAQARGEHAVSFNYVVFPAPDEFRGGFYYEFATERVNEVKPVGLKGYITYSIGSDQVDATGMPAKPPHFSGQLLGESRGDAAFVVISDHAISYKSQKVRVNARENGAGPFLASADGKFVFVDEAGKKFDLPPETSYGMRALRARSALFIQPEGGATPYLLVKWEKEEGSCDRIASLYWLSREAQIFKSNRVWRCVE